MSRLLAVVRTGFVLCLTLMLMLSPIQSKHSKCVTLESPKRLYDKLLIHTDENFGNKEKEVFEFSFRSVLPCAVLETRNSFEWFRCLEQRGKLSWMDISSLTEFFEEASIKVLVSSAQEYQAKIKIIRFLQRHLQVKLPEIRLGRISTITVYDLTLS